MNEIPEAGCQVCGSSLIRAAAAPLHGSDPPMMNQCDECGFKGDFKVSFYWTRELQGLVSGTFRELDMKAFRLHPRGYVNDVLNPWLRAQDKGEVVPQGTDKALHLEWRRAPHEL